MPRVDELLAYLRGRPAACRTCRSALVMIAGPGGIRVSACPTCDVTAGVRPVRPRSEAAVHHDRVHFAPIPGCAACRSRWRPS